MQRVTEFSRSKQGRGLIRQVQERLTGGGRQGPAPGGGRGEAAEALRVRRVGLLQKLVRGELAVLVAPHRRPEWHGISSLRCTRRKSPYTNA